MPKKRSATVNKISVDPVAPDFPPIARKIALHCEVLESDQILLIPDFFSAEECKRYTKFIDNLPLQVTPAAKRGEALRVNHRISITSATYAQALFSILSHWLPDFPYPASVAKPSNAARPAHSLNSNIRMYKYTPEQLFGPHYDDAVQDTETGAKSEWTLLIYLTGVEDGVQGGETVFYKGQGKSKQEVKVPLRRGMALLHRHGHECLLHEGSRVLKGVKYVLRSDVMFVG